MSEGLVAELTRPGTRHVVGVDGLLPRVRYRYDLDLHRMLDLTDPDARTQIGMTKDYSATGVDTVLVVFPQLLGPSLTEVELAERWDDLADLA